jgi:hypothetical protein
VEQRDAGWVAPLSGDGEERAAVGRRQQREEAARGFYAASS